MKNRDELAVIADAAKESVSALEVGKALGMDIRRNRCKCPFHNGKDYNCVLFNDIRGYYCHVCHASGDTINLVEEILLGGKQKGTFIQALRWLNDTFRLGFDIDTPADKEALKQAKKRLKRKADDKAFHERVERLDNDMFLTVSDVLYRLEQQRDNNRPRKYSDDWNPAFCEAVRMIPDVKESIEYFSIQRTVVRT